VSTLKRRKERGKGDTVMVNVMEKARKEGKTGKGLFRREKVSQRK